MSSMNDLVYIQKHVSVLSDSVVRRTELRDMLKNYPQQKLHFNSLVTIVNRYHTHLSPIPPLTDLFNFGIQKTNLTLLSHIQSYLFKLHKLISADTKANLIFMKKFIGIPMAIIVLTSLSIESHTKLNDVVVVLEQMYKRVRYNNDLNFNTTHCEYICKLLTSIFFPYKPKVTKPELTTLLALGYSVHTEYKKHYDDITIFNMIR